MGSDDLLEDLRGRHLIKLVESETCTRGTVVTIECVLLPSPSSTKVRDFLAPVSAWFTEGFDNANLKEAKALLDELA